MFKTIFSILTISILLSGCNNSVSSGKETITVTIEPLKYLTEQVVGDDFDINVLVPFGASPETYEPTPANMRHFEKSKLFIAIGLMECEFEIVKNSKSKDNIAKIELKDSVELIEGLCTMHNHENHSHTVMDPHIWSNPSDAKIIVNIIEQNASRLKPENSERYKENAYKFNLKIDSLDLYIKDKFANIKQRDFIIYHPALTYYARSYGLNQISIEEGGKESSAKHLKSIIDGGREIKYVFYQAQFSKSSVESICNEIGAKAVEIDPLAYDWLKNMYSITDALHKSMN